VTIIEAMKAAQEIFPDEPDVHLNLEIDVYSNGIPRITRWIFTNALSRRVVSSERSWEHALAKAKAENPDAWPELNDAMEEVEP
jgi:hypothetical protein